ncbi:MAG: M20 family metallopeptidase [Planctomycetaceae bacterium]|nr:M20 family metallopeptidase [Planctomycetaceae bacterium]
MPEIDTTSSVTEILCQLISIPSVNPMGRDLTGEMYLEEKLSDWLVDFFQAIGADYERIEVAPGRANVIAKYESPDSDLTLLIDAHQDTVPVDGMTIAPFEPVVKDGRITGRGSCDVKGGLAAGLFAFRRLVQEKPAGAACVILSCTCDEEATTIGINHFIKCWQPSCDLSRLVNSPPDAAIICEPTELDVVVAHRGVTRFRVNVAGRACHSSEPTQGVNAIYRMARVLNVLEEYASQLSGSIPAHDLCGEATISVGRITGGISVNIVPDLCSIEIDRRMIPGEKTEDVLRDVKEYVTSRIDFEVEFEQPWVDCPALNNHNNHWVSEPLLKCIEAVDGVHQAVGVPYCTHASGVGTAGVPSVVLGPGNIEQAHTKDEYIEIDQLEKAAEIYYQFCVNPPSKPSV